MHDKNTFEASGAIPNQNRKPEIRIRAGAGQSHESPSENWKSESGNGEKNEASLKRNLKPETGNDNPGWSPAIAREPGQKLETGNYEASATVRNSNLKSETGNRKLKSGLDPGNLAKARPETGKL